MCLKQGSNFKMVFLWFGEAVFLIVRLSTQYLIEL